MRLLILLPAVLGALSMVAATDVAGVVLPGELPPQCQGLACRRATCGDVCTATDCSHAGNVCAGGVSAPAGPGWRYESSFEAPPYPTGFNPKNATIFYYFNLLSQGQFVPQLTLGDGLCNGTGAPLYDCASCGDVTIRSKQWFMQAQYYWAGHDPNQGNSQAAQDCLNRRGSRSGAAKTEDDVPNQCHVVAGDLIPVNPGEIITTVFTMDANRAWHASISSSGSNATSQIQVPYPYMEQSPRLQWPPTAGLGVCMEVDDLMDRSYYPTNCPPITVTVTAPAGTADGWQRPWIIDENPTCTFGPSASTAVTTNGVGTATTTIRYLWPAEA